MNSDILELWLIAQCNEDTAVCREESDGTVQDPARFQSDTREPFTVSRCDNHSEILRQDDPQSSTACRR